MNTATVVTAFLKVGCTLLAARHRDLQERLQRVDLVEQFLVFRRAAQPSLSEATPIVRYEFRMRESGKYAVSQTAEHAVDNACGIVGSTNRMPRSPFEELIASTGSADGLTRASSAVHVSVAAVGLPRCYPEFACGASGV